MYKSLIIDLCIILFGVMAAWVCAWKAHHYYNLEQYLRSAFYATVVVLLLIIVVLEAIRTNP